MTSSKVSVYMKTSLQIPWLTSLPSTLTPKKKSEDEIFGRQDILQFFSGEFKGFKYVQFSIDVRRTLRSATSNLDDGVFQKKEIFIQNKEKK